MEVELTPSPEDDTTTIATLYEASLNGCVSTLNTIIQRKPLILHKVSLSPFNETPLHIASLLGHLEFCKILLTRKPSLASEVDSEGRCPLHLASAEGHTEVVKALLLENSDICMALDKDDKIPLHLAAMRGRIGAIKKLISASPDSVRVMIDDDASVLLLCVLHNHFEALKFLVQSLRGDQRFMLAKDKEGNTLLHLAVRQRQIKTIKYLLVLAEMRTAATALNRKGFTALDMLEDCPRDFISLAIRNILIEAGALRSADMMDTTTQQPVPSPSIASEAEQHQSKRMKKWEKLWARYLQYQGNWIEEARGTLMVVATVIATMTFQSAVSPPGGVWQEDTNIGGRNCTSYDNCEAGTAVLAYAWPHEFLQFTTFNTTSFFSSLCVVLLLISGFPLKNNVIMWILTIAMTAAVTFMALTYIYAQALVAPYHIIPRVTKMSFILAGAWVAILVVIGLIQIVRLAFWLWVKKKLHRSTGDMSARIGPLCVSHDL